MFYINIKKKNHELLHVIDEGAQFKAALMLKNHEKKSIWNVLIRCWTSRYNGIPNRFSLIKDPTSSHLLLELQI